MATRVISPGDVSENIHWHSHSDLPNEFYSLLLGRSMSSSCGYFTAPGNDLEAVRSRRPSRSFGFLSRIAEQTKAWLKRISVNSEGLVQMRRIRQQRVRTWVNKLSIGASI
jgi:hypothetical protein